MRYPHVHVVMVMIAMTLATSTAALVSTTTQSHAAPRNALTLSAADALADDVLLPNQTDIVIERFLLRAGREDMTIDTLSFQNCVTGSARDYDGDCADTGETAGTDAAIAEITLLYNDGMYDRATRGSLSDGRVTFTDLALTLPTGGETPVALRITTGSIDDVTVASGAQFQMNLNAITAPFHGVVVSSGTEVLETHVQKNVVGSPRTLRQTLTTLALSSASPQGPIEDDWSEAFRVNISASSTGDAAVDGLTLVLDVTNNGGSNWHTCPFLGANTEHFALVDPATGITTPATWELYDESGVACASSEQAVGYLHVTFDTPLAITADTTATLALFLNATYANTTYHDLLQVSIPAEDDLADLPVELHAITWSDGTTSGTDLDGSDVASLPVTGNILVF